MLTREINPHSIRNLSVADQILFARFGFGLEHVPAYLCVHHAFEAHAISQPNAVAVEHLGESITYAELDRQANAVATQLRQQYNVGPGSRVVLLVERSILMVVGIMAILKAGGGYVPLDGVIVTQSTLDHVVKDSGCNVAVVLDRFAHRITGVPVVRLEQALPRPGEFCARPEDVSSPSDTAYVIYTSGTTGKPKGVEVMHGNVTNLVCLSPGNVEMAPGMRVSQLLNISFDMAAWEILGSMTNGCTLCIRGKSSKEWRAVMKQVDIVIATPSMMGPHNPADYPNIKVVATAGEVCPKTLADSWAKSAHFYNCCGPTEITIVNTLHLHKAGEPLSIGGPSPNNNVYVLDEDMNPLPIGEVGVMWAGGAGISRGYLNDPVKTADRYKLDPFLKDGSIMFNTGDLGRWNALGELEHYGRTDDQVKVKGFRVELDGVGAAMETHPDVKVATALLINDELWGFVTPANVNTAEVKDATGRVQPYYAVPSRWHTMAEFPHTANGKIDKRALREIANGKGKETAPGPSPQVQSAPSSSPQLLAPPGLFPSPYGAYPSSAPSFGRPAPTRPFKFAPLSTVSLQETLCEKPEPWTPKQSRLRCVECVDKPEGERCEECSGGGGGGEQLSESGSGKGKEVVLAVPPPFEPSFARSPAKNQPRFAAAAEATQSMISLPETLYEKEKAEPWKPGKRCTECSDKPEAKRCEECSTSADVPALEKGNIWDGYKEEVLPDKKQPKTIRNLRFIVFSLYRRLFSVVFMSNMIALIILSSRGGNSINPKRLGEIVVANFFAGILMRQDYVVNGFFNVFTSVPRSWPLWIRRIAARVYTIGGLHSGFGVSGLVWLLFFTVRATRDYRENKEISFATITITYIILLFVITIIAFAMPNVRAKFHNGFEAIHRYLGWTVTGLVWAQTILITNDYKSPDVSLGKALTRSAPFWLVVVMTGSLALSWTYLQKVPVVPEVLSSHCVRLNFTYTTPRLGCFVRLSHQPLSEWHSFATISEPLKYGFSLVVSRAGDWTNDIIKNPPRDIWVRGIPTKGVIAITPLFRRVVLVATGSGIGPCAPAIFEGRVPIRVLWTARDVRGTFGDKLVDQVLAANPGTVVYDTGKNGKPDMVKLTYRMVQEFKAEAVIIISNETLTKKVVYGLMSRGIPAFGAIWDS